MWGWISPRYEVGKRAEALDDMAVCGDVPRRGAVRLCVGSHELGSQQVVYETLIPRSSGTVTGQLLHSRRCLLSLLSRWL